MNTEWYLKIYDAWISFQAIFIPLGALISIVDLRIRNCREKRDNEKEEKKEWTKED